MFFVFVFNVAAYSNDVRLGVAWSYNHMKDPNPARTDYSLGDVDINGIGISIGTAFENYSDAAFWADVSVVFPGQFKFDGVPMQVPANSYLYYSEIAAGGAMTFDLKNAEFYLGLGYSIKDLAFRYDLDTHGRYREYNLLASGPAAYAAAKIEMGRDLSFQLTAIPTMTIYTVRITRDKGGISSGSVKDFLFTVAFAVDASLSICYTF